MVHYITNFLLTHWLWSITGGFWHLCVNSLLLFLLLKLWDHLPFIRALALSLFLTVGSFVIFFTVVGGLMWAFDVSYTLPEDPMQGTYNILNASLVLAGIYIALQTAQLNFFYNWISPKKFWRTFLCIVCSNIITALLVYKVNFPG